MNLKKERFVERKALHALYKKSILIYIFFVNEAARLAGRIADLGAGRSAGRFAD